MKFSEFRRRPSDVCRKPSMISSDADGVGLIDSHPPPSMVVDESVQMNHVGGDAESQSEI